MLATFLVKEHILSRKFLLNLVEKSGNKITKDKISERPDESENKTFLLLKSKLNKGLMTIINEL